MTPGRRAMQTVIGGIQSGMAVCYELYFPDLFRAMARGGTTLVMVPASWPLMHVSRWEILARAGPLKMVYMYVRSIWPAHTTAFSWEAIRCLSTRKEPYRQKQALQRKFCTGPMKRKNTGSSADSLRSSAR